VTTSIRLFAPFVVLRYSSRPRNPPGRTHPAARRTELAARADAEAAPTIRFDGEVTAVEAVAVEVDEPIAGRAEFGRTRRCVGFMLLIA
jgi:hypothetical protein